MLPLIADKEAEMPHAIIRRENGRRHEVDFGDAPDRVQIYASEETVEFFSRRISRRSRRNVGASRFSTFPATCLAKLPPQRRDVPRTPSCIVAVTNDVVTGGPGPPAFPS
jgi:hypothetical protein